MKSPGIILSSQILLIVITYSRQTCDTSTCEFCCIQIATESEPQCIDNIHECQLKQINNFFNVYIMLAIFVFWCVGLPMLVNIAKAFMIGRCCFGISPCNCLYLFYKQVDKTKGLIGKKLKSKIRMRKKKRDLWGIIRTQFRSKKLNKIAPENRNFNSVSGGSGEQDNNDYLF